MGGGEEQVTETQQAPQGHGAEGRDSTHRNHRRLSLRQGEGDLHKANSLIPAHCSPILVLPLEMQLRPIQGVNWLEVCLSASPTALSLPSFPISGKCQKQCPALQVEMTFLRL